MAWLLDTNILSELRLPKPEQRVVAFVAGCGVRSGSVRGSGILPVLFFRKEEHNGAVCQAELRSRHSLPS
jgi:hypothetical protein